MSISSRWFKAGALVLPVLLWSMPVSAVPDITLEIGGQTGLIGFSEGPAAGPGATEEAIARALGPGWSAARSLATGRISILRGPGTAAYSGGPENAAKAFIGDLRSELGLSDADDVKVLKVGQDDGKIHVRLQQTFQGVVVEGAQILVHMTPEGSVTMVQNGSVPLAQPANRPGISEEEAGAAALSALRAELGDEALLDPPAGELVLTPYKGRRWYAWKITVASDNPLGLWVVYIDAQNSLVLQFYNSIVSLKNGKGAVFRTDADALLWKWRTTTLKNLFTAEESGWPYGYPIGRAAFVGQTDGEEVFEGDAYAPDHKFIFDPLTTPDAFDEVTAYYHLDKTHTWWSTKIIQDKKNGFIIENFNAGGLPAAVVNRTGDCNAYYTPALPGWDGPGWVFYNENECYEGSRDFTHDAGIIYHEFTHAVENWCGSLLSTGPLHRYPRAMGEGNADYFSCAQRNSPRINEVIDAQGVLGALRDLSGQSSGQRVYPDDVDWLVTHEPEEHWTGEIWGQFLWDLRALFKARADQYVWKTNTFYLLNLGGHDPTYIDFFDWAVGFVSMLVDDKPFGQAMSSQKQLNTFIKSYPAFTDRGIFTTDAYNGVRADNAVWFYFNINGRGKMTFRGNLRTIASDPAAGGNPSEYFFILQYAAENIVVKVTSGKQGLSSPAVRVRDALNGTVYAPDETRYTATLAQIEFLSLPLARQLVVDVYAPDGSIGKYTLTLSSK
jgi:hypothetical protein